MKKITIEQGTPEWHELRQQHFCASEAPAMLGLSKYMSRTGLLDAKAGKVQQHDAGTLARFEAGHQTEAAAREVINAEGFDYQPAVFVTEIEGLPLLASLDGYDETYNAGWEHKLWNEELAASVAGGVIPDQYRPQLEQQAMCSGADVIRFTVSDGATRMVSADYTPDPELRRKIIIGWQQFKADLAAHSITEKVEAVATLGGLPALVADVEGRVIATNVDAYRATALAMVDTINTSLESDADFITAEADCKWCKRAEDELASAKEAVLSKTADVAAIIKTLAEVSEAIRQKRLALEKLVKTEKEARKAEKIRAVEIEWGGYVEKINKRLVIPLTVGQASFHEAIKGKKTLASVEDALRSCLVEKCAEAERLAGEMQKRLDTIQPVKNLFPDVVHVVRTMTCDEILTEAEKRQAAIDKANEEKLAAQAALEAAQQAAAQAATAQPMPTPEPVPEPARTPASVFLPSLASADGMIEIMPVDCSFVAIKTAKGIEYKLIDHDNRWLITSPDLQDLPDFLKKITNNKGA